jgi:cyclopropane fatty-acyl-phospholipid synthase-like methyltransferase
VGAVVENCNEIWEIWDPEEAALVEAEKVSKQRIDRLAEMFYDKLTRNDRVLDLGCCRGTGATESGNDFRI